MGRNHHEVTQGHALVALGSHGDEILAALREQLAASGQAVELTSVNDSNSLTGALLANDSWSFVFVDESIEAVSPDQVVRLAKAVDRQLPVFIVSSADAPAREPRHWFELGVSDWFHLDRLERLPFAVLRELRHAELRRDYHRLDDEQGSMMEAADQSARNRRDVDESLKEALEARDSFLKAASHELRTPLTPLILNLTMLARDLESTGHPELQRRAKQALRGGRRLAQTVDEMLDVERAQEGRLKLQLQSFNLREMVSKELELHERTASKTGTVLRAEVPSLRVGWDRRKTAHLIRNLLSNAVKFGSGHPVVVRASRSGDMVHVRIEDEGPGVSEADRERIFRLYERAASVDAFGGLGLGLYVARHLAQLHGGRLYVRRAESGGASFVLEMPIQARPPVERRHASSAAASAHANSGRGHGRRPVRNPEKRQGLRDDAFEAGDDELSAFDAH